MADTTQQQDGQKATGQLPTSARVVVIGGGQ